VPRTHAGALISEGDDWRYYKGNTHPPGAWNQVGFDDSGWGGPAPSGFGYEDGDDATLLEDMPTDPYASVFIRKTFVMANTAAVTHLTLAVDYDDGFVAYINGAEVWRQNMPGGTITNTTLASGGHDCSRSDDSTSNDKEFFSLSTASLVNGTNVLAVSGHNSTLGSSDFSLIVELYTNITLLRGPFIQMPETNGVTVVWRTDALCDSVVQYGTDTNYAAGTVSNGSLVRHHAVTLTGLAPGSSYFYRVRSGGVTLSEGAAFRARAATNQAIRFIAYGDFGYSGPGTTSIAARMAMTNADFALTVGDNIYLDGQPGDYDAFWFAPHRETMRRTATFPALGNHDVHFENTRWYVTNFFLPTNGPAGFRETVYSYDYGNAHFAVIDSNPFATNSASARSAIRTWLSNDLSTSSARWKFVQLHHPPYTSEGSHGPNTLVLSDIVPVLEAAGVDMVFQGHNHFYERINPINGVHYLTAGGGGQSLHALTTQRDYSATVYNSLYSFTVVDIDGAKFDLRTYNENGALVDAFAIDKDHPFEIDGLLDNAAWGRATNGLVLYAAIRGTYLYLATQDAGEGSDHFIYLHSALTTTRPANWAKSGQVMQWSAFLADEDGGGYSGWFDPADAPLGATTNYRSMTSGLDDNGPSGNGVLEGTINLAAHFGAFPSNLYVAAAPFGSADGGALVTAAQVPTGDGDGQIKSYEFLALDPRAIALDLPVAEAGPGATNEAGMKVTVNGSGSSAPSGLPMSYSWSGAKFADASSATTLAWITNNVATNVTILLTVNDTRFSSNDTVTLTFVPMVDSDGDGLSDGEEATGQDNVLTAPDPAGRITSTNSADSDGDGYGDGQEALAGTNPNDNTSLLRMVQPQQVGPELVVRWSSASNRSYELLSSSNLASGYGTVASNIAATPPANAWTVPVTIADQLYYFIRAGP
jgi:hypothetical protein